MKVKIAWLLFIAAGIGVGLALASKRDARPPGSFSGRLLLASEYRLEIAPALARKDSFAIDFSVAVPPAHKFQRHLCLLSANREFNLKTTPLQRWALRGDTLMVLSEVKLTLSARADSSQPLVLKFDFVNLDADPNVRGTATLLVSAKPNLHAAAPTPAPVAAPAEAAVPDTGASAGASTPLTKNGTAQKDTVTAQTSTVPDSAAAQAQVHQNLDTIAETVPEDEHEQLWVPIAFLLLGIALIALFSLVTKTKSRDSIDKTRSRLETMVVPVNHQAPVPASNLAPAAKAESAEAGSAIKSFATVTGEGVRELLRDKENLPVTQAAAAPIDLFADDLGASGRPATPAGLQTALHKLRNITAETQKVLAVQYQALDQFARHTEIVRGFLLENPAPQESATAGAEAPASESQRNGHDRAAEEGMPAEISLRVLPAEEKGYNFEEVASAIDVLIAASEAKPLVAPAAAMSHKIESLRRIGNGLQQLAGICRALALSAPLAGVENLARKVQDLQTSCEAWRSDRSVKLSFSLPRTSPAGTPARREIVDAIVDSLHETRKIAVQGPIYFERRVTQLLEYDLPKLRQQLKEIENEEMRRVWDGMGL
jgi:hypothetical protein